MGGICQVTSAEKQLGSSRCWGSVQPSSWEHLSVSVLPRCSSPLPDHGALYQHPQLQMLPQPGSSWLLQGDSISHLPHVALEAMGERKGAVFLQERVLLLFFTCK